MRLKDTDIVIKRPMNSPAIATMLCAATLAISSANAVTGSDPVVPKHGDSEPPLQITAQHVILRPSDTQADGEQRWTLQCPLGYVPTRYSITAAHADDGFFVQTGEQMIDRNKSPVDRAALANAGQLNGGGYVITLASLEEARQYSWSLELALLCVSLTASTDHKLSLVASTSVAPASGYSTEIAYCPDDYPVAFGGFSNSDAVSLQDIGSAPAWGTSSNPLLLQLREDGPTAAPAGWQSKVFNHREAPARFVAYTLCGKAPAAKAFIYSTQTWPGQPFSIFAVAPPGFSIVGGGADAGPYGIDKGFDAWVGDATLVNFQAWHATSTSYNSGVHLVRAYIAQGTDDRIKVKAVSQRPERAVAAVVAISDPDSVVGTYPVTVIEFYNAALDHYFITPNTREIQDLDTGVHVGWRRTGQSFKVYGWSAGAVGLRPVCRAYGRPEAGLNSHFYSANRDECFAALATLDGAWQLEASEVFQVYPPDSITGGCPSGHIPVYRTWNGRADSNHRYTASMASRDEMITKGHVAEGYGSNGVALCAVD